MSFLVSEVPLYRFRASGFAQALSLKIWSLKVWCLGFRVQGLGLTVWGLGFRVLRFRIEGLGFKFWSLGLIRGLLAGQRDWYFIAEQPAPAPHLAHSEGCASLRIVLVTVPSVSRPCEHFPDGFDLHLLHAPAHKQELIEPGRGF